MAVRIPTYQAEAIAQAPGVPRLDSRAFRAPVAALEGLADTAGRIAQQEIVRTQDAEDGDFVATQTAELTQARHKALVEGQRTAPAGAKGFTDAQMKAFQDDLETRVKQAPGGPKGRAATEFRLRAMRLQNTLWEDASTFEHQAGQAYRRDNLGKSLRGYANMLLTSPGGYDQAAQAWEDAVDLHAPDFNEQELGELRQKGRGELADATLTGWAEADPAKALELMQGGRFDVDLNPDRKAVLINRAGVELKQRENEAHARALDAYRAEVDSYVARDPIGARAALGGDLAAAVEHVESGGNARAVSPKGALGSMQLMPETAQEAARDLGLHDVAALSGDALRDRLLTDQPLNRALGRAYLDKMQRRYAGSRVLALAAYNAGPGQVDEWLGRLGDPRTGRVSEAEWASRIPFAETRAYVQKVQGRMTPSLPGPDDAATREAREKTTRAADVYTDQLEREWQPMEQLLDAGIVPAGLAEFAGRAAGTPLEIRIQAAQEGLRETAAFMSQPLPAQQQQLAAMRPAEDGEASTPAEVATYARFAKAHDAAVEAVKADPLAAYVRQTGGQLQPFDGSPAATAARQRMAGEAAAWTGRPVPLLTKPEAEAFVETWKGPGTDGQKLGALAGITVGLRDDATAQAVLGQLNGAGLPVGVDVAMERLREGDSDAAKRIVGAISLPEAKLPKPPEDFKAALDDLYDDETGAEIDHWLVQNTGTSGDYAQYARNRSLVTRLARASGLSDATGAVAAAALAVYGKGPVLADESIAMVRLPAGADPDALADGFAALRQGLNLSTLNPPTSMFAADQARDQGPMEGARSLAMRDQEAWAQRVRDEGVFINHGDGFALLTPSGLPVPGPDGSVRIWTLTEVQAAAAADPGGARRPLRGGIFGQ